MTYYPQNEREEQMAIDMERAAIAKAKEREALASAPSVPQPDEGLKAELARIDAVLARRPALDKPTRVENVEHAITTAGRMTDRVSRLEVERDIITRALPAWAHDTGDVPLSAQVRAAFVTMSAEIEKLKLDLANAKFAPIGDNHHNAAACPYCSPKLPSASQEEPTQATRIALEMAHAFLASVEMNTDALERDRSDVLHAVTDALEALSSSAPVERPPLPRSEETQFWAVTVSRNGDDLVTIETNCLSGKPEFSEEDARVIRMAAEHLSAFIGPEERETFIPCDHDYVWVQETVLNGTQYRCEICGHVKWEKAPAETQEERLPERHPRLNTERARLEQAFNEGSWSSVDNPSPEHDAAMRVVVDWLMGIGPEPVGPGHQLPDESQPSPETPAKETR